MSDERSEIKGDKMGRLTALSPVVAGTVLAENKVVGPEKCAKGGRANGVHGAGLEVDEDGARNILVG